MQRDVYRQINEGFNYTTDMFNKVKVALEVLVKFSTQIEDKTIENEQSINAVVQELAQVRNALNGQFTARLNEQERKSTRLTRLSSNL